MKANVLVLALGCAWVLVGCANSNVSTVVHADGSFDRKIERVTYNKGAMQPTASTFVLPKSGHKHKAGNEATWVTNGHYPRGRDAVHDAVIKNGYGQRVVANEVKVRPLGDGRWIFIERYHWIGKPLKDSDLVTPLFRSVVKKALGEGFSSAQIDRISACAVRDLIKVAAGSSAYQEGLGRAPEPPKRPKYGVKTPDPNAEFEKEFVARLRADSESDSERAAAPRVCHALLGVKSGKLIDDRLFTFEAINLSVRVPGSIVSTNGTRSGKNLVRWTVFLLGVATGDIDLTVVYRIPSIVVRN